MTRPATDLDRVKLLHDEGVPTAEIARRTGIPRSTMRYWIGKSFELDRTHGGPSERCPRIEALAVGPYAYLLGLYLGDGYISRNKRGVYRLRITLDSKYQGIIEECVSAVAMVMPQNRVGRLVRIGCTEVYANSMHWPCLFPQHGPGPKHRRPIVLETWQEVIALDRFPHLFLRGLVESDGWRGTNRVPGGYEYPCYQFSNRSSDIRHLFQLGCERLGINSRQSGRWQVAVSRRRDVARMDVFVGGKR